MAFDDILEAEDIELVFDGEDFVARRDYEEDNQYEPICLQNPTVEEMTKLMGSREEVPPEAEKLPNPPNLRHLNYINSNQYLAEITP